MRRLILAVQLAAVVFAGFAWCQTPKEFEVASIKPSAPGVDSSTSDLLPGGRFRVTNKTVVWLLRAALGVADDQILGGPGWLRTDAYDIDAKTGGAEAMTPEMLKPLLLQLLADRFQLRYHTETKPAPVYYLTAAKGAAKLKAHAGDSGPQMSNSMSNGKMTLEARRVSMTDLASFLTRQVHRKVVDRTGIAGEFDVSLEWAPDESADSAASGLFTAIREQLGLKMESGKGDVMVAVVDGASRVSGN